MLNREEIIKCPWCNKGSTLGKWNDETYSYCTNREMKRDFLVLTNESAFRKNSVSFYICPECSRWSRGNQLILIKNHNSSNEKLGSEPLIKSISNKNSNQE